MKMAYGVCVGSWDRLRANVIPHIGDSPLLALSGQTSIAVAYNLILDACCNRGYEVVVLIHDDLEIIDPDIDAKLKAALADPDVALVSVAGGQQPINQTEVLAWWDIPPCIGHQVTDSYLIDFGERTGEIDTPEGSFLAFGPWAIEHLRFDAGIPGFHGYDVDIGFQARSQKKKVIVADLDTHHHTLVGFQSETVAAAWRAANIYVANEWNL